MELKFDSLDEFIRFINFIFPDTKESDAVIEESIKELKDGSSALDNAVKNSEGTDGTTAS